MLLTATPSQFHAPTFLFGERTKPKSSGTSFQHEAVLHILEKSHLSEVFFSAENIEALMQGIRYQVYRQTQQVIGRQSESELRVIMRAKYLQHAKHLPVDILPQVQDLNKLVLEEAVRSVISELKMHQHYIRQVSRLPVPMDHGAYASSAGTRSGMGAKV